MKSLLQTRHFRSFRRLFGFMAFWWLAALLGFYGWSCFHSNGEYAEVLREFMEYKLSIGSACGVAAAMLGGFYYLVLRKLSPATTPSFKFKEAGVVAMFAILIASYPGYIWGNNLITTKLMIARWQPRLDDEIETLVAKGEFNKAVRRMDQACEISKVAREKLASRGERYPPLAANGYGYFFCTLGYAWLDLSDFEMPCSLFSYFNMEPHYSITEDHPLENPEKWAALGREMTVAKTPILQALGYHLLEDREQFSTTVYRYADSGDPSFRALAASLPYQIDPDARRSIQRLRQHPEDGLPAGELKDYLVEDRDGRIFQLALTLLEQGEELGDNLDTILDASRRFVKTPNCQDSGFSAGMFRRSPFYRDLTNFVESGNTRAAVARMEQACATHRKNRERLGADCDDFYIRIRHVGFHSLFENLHFVGLDLHMPPDLYYFLDGGTEDDSNYMQKGWDGKTKLKAPSKWEPLAKEMSASTTPILSAIGYWLLGDRERFIETVNRQFDSGDRSFQQMNTYVEFEVDLDRQRVIRRRMAR